jgi:hypothetical protein
VCGYAGRGGRGGDGAWRDRGGGFEEIEPFSSNLRFVHEKEVGALFDDSPVASMRRTYGPDLRGHRTSGPDARG